MTRAELEEFEGQRVLLSYTLPDRTVAAGGCATRSDQPVLIVNAARHNVWVLAEGERDLFIDYDRITSVTTKET